MQDCPDLHSLALDLIGSQSTMALATAVNSQAWAAPVYYVFYSKAFYFFSSPKSKHICQALEANNASATIYPFVFTWQEIQGLQMSGYIEKVSPGLKAIQAVRAYAAKYPFLADFFDASKDIDLENLGKRFKVRLYRFVPSLIYYLDNRIYFGFREKIQL
jgi:uncharacterized protein YhbP (UPF0306 family)